MARTARRRHSSQRGLPAGCPRQTIGKIACPEPSAGYRIGPVIDPQECLALHDDDNGRHSADDDRHRKAGRHVRSSMQPVHEASHQPAQKERPKLWANEEQDQNGCHPSPPAARVEGGSKSDVAPDFVRQRPPAAMRKCVFADKPMIGGKCQRKRHIFPYASVLIEAYVRIISDRHKKRSRTMVRRSVGTATA